MLELLVQKYKITVKYLKTAAKGRLRHESGNNAQGFWLCSISTNTTAELGLVPPLLPPSLGLQEILA